MSFSVTELCLSQFSISSLENCFCDTWNVPSDTLKVLNHKHLKGSKISSYCVLFCLVSLYTQTATSDSCQSLCRGPRGFSDIGTRGDSPRRQSRSHPRVRACRRWFFCQHSWWKLLGISGEYFLFIWMMHLKKHYIFSTRSKSNIFILSFKSDNLSQFSFDLFTTSTSISCLYAYMAALNNLDPFL